MNEINKSRMLFTFRIIAILILCAFSVYILQEVFKQFFSESSTFKQTEKPIEEFPTITICTPNSKLKYGVDLNITIGLHGYEFQIQERGNIISLSEDAEDIIVTLEQFNNYVISGSCYKINRSITEAFKTLNDGYTTIRLSFNKSIPYDNLPDTEFFLTSEQNFPGVLYYEWMDGEELHLHIPKVFSDYFRTNMYIAQCTTY